MEMPSGVIEWVNGAPVYRDYAHSKVVEVSSAYKATHPSSEWLGILEYEAQRRCREWQAEFAHSYLG